MNYVTYENRNNPHITIHRKGCNHIKKNGGIGRGRYEYHDTLESACDYASNTSLPVRKCSFCKP